MKLQYENDTDMFDVLSKLYVDDPDAYEEKRREIIEEFINDLPEDKQRRAKGLQFQINSKLDTIKNPTERYNQMVNMFWESFAKLNATLHGKLPEPQTHTKAKIIKLKS